MAKIKIELELDYIDPEYGLEEGILDQVKKDLSTSIINKNVNKIETNINDNVKNQLSKEVTKIVRKFLNNGPIKITDEYGRTKKESASMEDLIIENFKNALFDKVDEDGRNPTYSSKKSQTRLDYIINENVKKHLDKKLEDTLKGIKETLEKKIEDDLTKTLGRQLYETLKLKEVIAIENKTGA